MTSYEECASVVSNSDNLPREFGKYYLIERVATGGMAELFRAKLYGAGGFEKDLAIKKVLPQLSTDDAFVQMFMDEAMITVTLSHGNIVSVLDFGEMDGDYYLVMEFVDGVDLQSVIKKSQEIDSPIPPAIAGYIALQVCRGLDYAHRKVGPDGNPLLIVHRDISPQNILISFEGEVKIVDFGIARAASRITSTQAGVVKGKLAYMSPEQIAGEIVDKRADVYSAGIFLYEMLTNSRPYEGSTPQETMALITRGAYEKAHKRNKKVDKKLSAVVRKSLERNPKKRYLTAGEMAADLSSYLHRAGLYPDATTLAEFVSQRLPDVRPRTIQPTPIRAIRRKTDEQIEKAVEPPAGDPPPAQPARTGTDVLTSPGAQSVKTAAPAEIDPDKKSEAVSFSMLNLPRYEDPAEPADSTRPTDPLREAVDQPPAEVQKEPEQAASQLAQGANQDLLSAETKMLEAQSEPAQQKSAATPHDPELLSAETKMLEAQSEPAQQKSAATPHDPELLSAETKMLEAQSEPAPQKSGSAPYDPELLSAETRMLEAQSEPDPAAPSVQVADSWMEEKAAAAASADSASIAAAAFPKRKTGYKIAALAAGLVFGLVAIWLIVKYSSSGDDPGATTDGPIKPVTAAVDPIKPDSKPETPTIDAGTLAGGPVAADSKKPSDPDGGTKVAVVEPKTPETGDIDKTAKTDPLSGKEPDKRVDGSDASKPPIKKPDKKPKDIKKPVVAKKPKIVKKPGQKKKKKKIKKVAVTKQPKQTGTLRINSEPFSVVFLGKRRIGPTPQMNVKLPIGSHTLTLKNDALGISKRIRVRIEANKVHTFFVELKKK
jgi:eukaryotic-like serine/threonine-protein kinase